MVKKVSALKARQNLGRIMDEVSLGGDDYIIERGGRPLVAIVKIEKYQQIKDNRKTALQSLGRIWEKMEEGRNRRSLKKRLRRLQRKRDAYDQAGIGYQCLRKRHS